MHKVTYLVNVSGVVQGVGFRYFSACEAKKLGVTGYVMNMNDGSVNLMISGDKTQVDIFANWLKQGPKTACVENIKIRELPWKSFSTFDIRY